MDDGLQDVEMHALVSGNVQGIGFRATTRYLASQLGLKGTVRNLPDGSVEIYAQGRKEQLEALIKRLKQEAFPGYIDNVSIQFTKPMHTFDTFNISH